MNRIKTIRERLGLSQATFGAEIGCNQSNVSWYERGQTVPPEMAKRIIALGKRMGLDVTYEDIYGPPDEVVGAAAIEQKAA